MNTAWGVNQMFQWVGPAVSAAYHAARALGLTAKPRVRDFTHGNAEPIGTTRLALRTSVFNGRQSATQAPVRLLTNMADGGRSRSEWHPTMTFPSTRWSLPMIRTVVLAAAFAFTSASVLAQTAPAKPAAKPAAKAAPKKAEKVLPPASPEQLQAAEYVHYGPYACEFNQSIDVALNAKAAGYVDVTFGKSVFTMKPVMSSTGALRLEDVTGRTLLLQIANKSMLMDVKAGRRLVDACVHEKQRTVGEAGTK